MFRLLFFAGLFWISAYVQAQSIIFPDGNTFYRLSENQQTPLSDLPHRDQWQVAPFSGIAFDARTYWVEIDFNIPVKSHQPQGVFVILLGAYDAYWDGEFIGQNGQFSTNKHNEIPGQIEAVFLLRADQATVGKHTLTLRSSSHAVPENVDSGLFYTIVGHYDKLLTLTFKRAILPMIMSGALLLIAFYCFFLYVFAWRETSYLYFGVLCCVVLGLYVAESWRGLWGYTYDWHIPRLQWVLALSWIASLLMCLFYGLFFTLKLPHRAAWVGLALLLQTVTFFMVNSYDERSLYLFMIGASVCLLMTLQAIFEKRNYAKSMLSALFVLLAPIYFNPRLYMEQYFFVAFTVLIGFVLYSLTMTFRHHQQAWMQSKLDMARLELMLIKRNLQPHFILNTLTAIEEWIEESPKTAVAFIQALADEFRYMAQLSSRQMISLQEEIDLCRAHLNVMGFRANATYQLDVAIINNSHQLPPGVLLTLLENALSHNPYSAGETVFLLQENVGNHGLTLVFIAPVHNHRQSRSLGTGTGMKYIRACMNAQFGQTWSLEETINQRQWRVELTFPVVTQSPLSLESELTLR